MSKIVDRQLTHLDHCAGSGRFPLAVMLDSVTNPANVGGIFRLADALGIAHLFLCGSTVSPPNRKLTRASRMTDRRIGYDCADDSVAVATVLREQGYYLIALELTHHSIDLKTIDYGAQEKICLILGAEKSGVSSGLLEIVDQTVHIPMLGQNSSMNVVAACAIAVYEITRHG